MADLKVRAIVRVKRATVEFAEGMGVGVLATQDITLHLPDDKPVSDVRIAAQLTDFGKALLDDSVEVIYEEVK